MSKVGHKNHIIFEFGQNILQIGITTCFGPQSYHKKFKWFQGSDDIHYSHMDTSLT
jgi:hypothetical protein